MFSDESLRLTNNMNVKPSSNVQLPTPPTHKSTSNLQPTTQKPNEIQMKPRNLNPQYPNFDHINRHEWKTDYNPPSLKPHPTNPTQYKNSCSTYSAEALISNTVQNTYPKSYPSTQQQYHPPTKRITPFDSNLFYPNDYVQDTNYFQTSTAPSGIYQPSSFVSNNSINNFITDFDTDFISNTAQSKPNNCLKNKSKISQTGAIKRSSSSSTTVKRKEVMQLPFPDLSFLQPITSVTSTTTDDLFYSHPNYFTTNTSSMYPSTTASSNLYSNKGQQGHEFIPNTHACNLLPPPPIPSATSLGHNILSLPPPSVALPSSLSTTQELLVSSSVGTSSISTIGSSTASALTNFNLSTIFPEINKVWVRGI